MAILQEQLGSLVVLEVVREVSQEETRPLEVQHPPSLLPCKASLEVVLKQIGLVLVGVERRQLV